jgi:hypothetical protein
VYSGLFVLSAYLTLVGVILWQMIGEFDRWTPPIASLLVVLVLVCFVGGIGEAKNKRTGGALWSSVALCCLGFFFSFPPLFAGALLVER